MALPSNPTNGDIAFIGNSVYQFDSVTNRWNLYRSERETRIEEKFDSDLTNFKINHIVDVNVAYTPEDGTILAWDSDLGVWNAQQFTQDPLGAIELKSERFLASASQTQFTMKHFAIGDVSVYRNGVALTTESYSVAGKVITYDPAGNLGSTLETDDEILVRYNRGTSIALTAELADLTDVDVTTTAPTSGDILSWNGTDFVPSDRLTEAEGDILQAVSDRIYTDNVLSARIDDNDSDIAAQTGNFYVQATPPPGKAHSGWVNTTTMRLNVWDVNEETWIEVSLT